MQDYKTGLCEEEKEEIIREFLPYIKFTAARLSWRIPPQLTMDDLISVGLMGLMDALERYEAGRCKLKTYAEFRIKGSMLDELRAFDWVPRSLKKKIQVVKNAYARLEMVLGRAPEEEEVAAELEIPLDDYRKTLQECNGAVVFRFEDFEGDGLTDHGPDILECIPDPNAPDPLRLLEDSERKDLLAKIIAELPEKESLLLSLYYWEELTMKEIGQVLKLTEGRVCQLHNQALIRLRSKLGPGSMLKESAVRSR